MATSSVFYKEEVEKKVKSLAGFRLHEQTRKARTHVMFFLKRGEEDLSLADGLLLLQHPEVLSESGKPLWELIADEIIEGNIWDGVFFEMPMISLDTARDMNFQFVLLNATAKLAAMREDRSAFAEHFDDAKHVVSFPNLSGDAILVVPTPQSAVTCYCHLKTFMVSAPREQHEAFWVKTAEEVFATVAKRNVFLSTHGTGIGWVHMRIDTVPKYFQFNEYK
jgi:hypothetical protein